MPHYTTFDVNPAVQPAQVMSVPRASEPVPPKRVTAPQSMPVSSPLIINSPGSVQFKAEGGDESVVTAGNQSVSGNGGADVTMEPTKPMVSSSGMAKDISGAGLTPLPPPPPAVPEKSAKPEDVCVSVGHRISVSGCADL